MMLFVEVVQPDNPFVIVVKSMYAAAGTMTAIVGLSPIQLVGLVVALGVVFMLWHAWGRLRGKSSWHLTPDDPE